MVPRNPAEFPCKPGLLDGMYEHRFTADEIERAMTQAGMYAAYDDIPHPFFAQGSLDFYRRTHLAGAAFEAFCDQHVPADKWEACAAWELCDELQSLYDARDRLSNPLSTCFTVDGTRVFTLAEMRGTPVCPQFEQHVIRFAQFVVGADTVIRVSIDKDESWGTVYGFVSDDGRVKEARDELTKADNPDEMMDEWGESLVFAGEFPPHLEPVSRLSE